MKSFLIKWKNLINLYNFLMQVISMYNGASESKTEFKACPLEALN